MQTNYSTKDMKPESIKNKDVEVVPHFFPQYSITIHATSRKEALEKLEEHIKSLLNNP